MQKATARKKPITSPPKTLLAIFSPFIHPTLASTDIFSLLFAQFSRGTLQRTLRFFARIQIFNRHFSQRVPSVLRGFVVTSGTRKTGLLKTFSRLKIRRTDTKLLKRVSNRETLFIRNAFLVPQVMKINVLYLYFFNYFQTDYSKDGIVNNNVL